MVSFRGVENRMPGYPVKVEGNAHVPVGSHTQERVDSTLDEGPRPPEDDYDTIRPAGIGPARQTRQTFKKALGIMQHPCGDGPAR